MHIVHIFKVDIGSFVLREDLAAAALTRIAVRMAFVVRIARMTGGGIVGAFFRSTLLACIGTSTLWTLPGLSPCGTWVNAESTLEQLAVGPIENGFSKGHEYEKYSEYEEEQTA